MFAWVQEDIMGRDLDYYRQRVAEELAREQLSANEATKLVHAQLAALYDVRIEQLSRKPK